LNEFKERYKYLFFKNNYIILIEFYNTFYIFYFLGGIY